MINWKGCGRKRSLPNLKVLSRHLRGETGGNDGINLCQHCPWFEIANYGLRSRSFNRSTTTFCLFHTRYMPDPSYAGRNNLQSATDVIIYNSLRFVIFRTTQRNCVSGDCLQTAGNSFHTDNADCPRRLRYKNIIRTCRRVSSVYIFKEVSICVLNVGRDKLWNGWTMHIEGRMETSLFITRQWAAWI
jgi:hypothetical protein